MTSSSTGRLPVIDMSKRNFTYGPGGVPYHWQAEMSGKLREAVQPVMLWIHHYEHGAITQKPTAASLRLAIDYAEYVLLAPCWQDDRPPRLPAFRARIKNVATIEELTALYQEARDTLGVMLFMDVPV